MNAFKYGAPPHGGLAYGLDRWVSLFAGLDSIRDCIAFPKNNSGRDVMLDAPAALDQSQLDELNLVLSLIHILFILSWNRIFNTGLRSLF